MKTIVAYETFYVATHLSKYPLKRPPNGAFHAFTFHVILHLPSGFNLNVLNQILAGSLNKAAVLQFKDVQLVRTASILKRNLNKATLLQFKDIFFPEPQQTGNFLEKKTKHQLV